MELKLQGRKAIITDIPLDLGNNFTMRHLISELAHNAKFLEHLDLASQIDGLEEIEIVSTELRLMPNLSRVIRETFVIYELVEMIDGAT